MSQTIAQRKALAARITPAPAAAEHAVVRDDRAALSRHFEPVSVQALRTLEALQKTGAQLIRIERGSVLVRRGSEVGVIDSAGRVRWCPVDPVGRGGPV